MPSTANDTRGPIGPDRYGARTPVTADTARGGLFEIWHDRNRQRSLPHAIRQLRLHGNLENLERLTGTSTAPFRGQLFADSDVYKTLEAVAWELGREEDESLRAFFEEAVALIAAAQREDGYLNSAFQDGGAREPWTDFAHGHELYCLGHLIEAAIAADRALHDRRLLRVVQRFVDLVAQRMGGDSPEYCGHPLIESALFELSRATNDPAAAALAEQFIRRRGSGFIGDAIFGATYYQDDVPALEAETMRGHAVRALYLNAGITDLYLRTGDRQALSAMEAQWHDLVRRRLYITGGTGSRHQDEAFGDAYELPADRAYSETCAGIALLGWAWRMYLATGEASYLDVGETALYNVVLAGISTDGTHFSYSNPLQRRREHVAGRQEESSERLAWFSCACCPPNLMRTVASLEHFIAAGGPAGLDIALYANVTIRYKNTVVTMSTSYPADGRIGITVGGDAPGEDLRLRIPAWATSELVARVDGDQVRASASHGWLTLPGALRDGAHIELELPLRFRWRYPHRRIDALRGTVALARGPVVYCAEQEDNAVDIDLVDVDARRPVSATAETTELGPLVTMTTRVGPDPDGSPLYGDASPSGATDEATLVLRPYATWGNHAPDAMRVWLPLDRTPITRTTLHR